MRITDSVDLFYPNSDAKKHGAQRRKFVRESGTMFAKDLEIDNIKKLISLMGSERFAALAEELNDDADTLNYRLDCLEDFINNPDLSLTFRKTINDLSGKTRKIDEDDETTDSFLDIKNKTEDLEFLLESIEEINKIYRKKSRTIKSAAMKGLFEFFLKLPETPQFKETEENLSELKKAFSKTIRSVKIGVNFTGNMIPDSAGIIEISHEKIYPKGNVLERMIFGTVADKETFSGEEHLNSITHKTPVDIDTALFRELSEYTRDYAARVSAALKSCKSGFFSDISELEQQLDYYESAAAYVTGARARGMNMCRPVFLPKSERRMKLRGAYDPNLYRKIVAQDASAVISGKLVVNDLDLSDEARFYMVTGANNGGKTTFARAAGLCQLMAQTGMYVPAEYAEISVCDNIYTHFPRDEQLGIDTSRFTMEIKDLKKIVCHMTKYSMVILNESLQSTTPDECLKIAEIHTEIMAAAGVRGLYVTHLTELYSKLDRINSKGYETTIASLVSEAEAESGRRLYKIRPCAPSGESLAFTIYKQFGATLNDIRESGEEQ